MKQFANLLLVLLFVIFTIVFVEGSSRLYNLICPAQATSWKEFRLSIPAPYKNAAYDIKNLIGESQNITWKTDPGYGYIPNDIHGNYVNIINGYRKTSNVTASSQIAKRFWFFGGSTVMCVEVPDKLTMPSYFDAMAKAKFGNNSIETINAGATTITIIHQVYRLRHMIDIKKGDIVIFVDGVNDVIQTLYMQNPTGTMIQFNREQIKSAGWLLKYRLLTYEKLSPYSMFVKRFLNPVTPSYLSVKVSADLLNTLEDNYLKAIKEADEYVKSRGGIFFHFLQPNLFTVNKLTSYEKSLLKNGYVVLIPLIDVYPKGYARLRKAVERAKKQGIFTFDISDAFNSRESAIFLDYCHVNEVGNELLASAIFSIVSKNLKFIKTVPPSESIIGQVQH